MFYWLLHYFNLMPTESQTICLISIAVIVAFYFLIEVIFVKKLSFSFYYPAILLTTSHICERFLRWTGNDIESEQITISTFIIVILIGWEIKKILNTSTMFAVAIGLIIFASSSHQNIMLFTFFVVLALILLLITALKSISFKNYKQLFLCIIAIILDMTVYSIKSNYLLTFLIAVLILYKLIFSKESNISKIQTILYIILFAIITYFFTPLFALECILIIEQIILCIKAEAPISLIVIFLGSFLAFWAYSCIFMNDILVFLFIVFLLFIKKYLFSWKNFSAEVLSPGGFIFYVLIFVSFINILLI